MNVAAWIMGFTIGMLWAVGAPSGAEARNIFVSPPGSGDVCTQAAPCSLAAGLAGSAAGDVVWLAAGTYTGSGSHVAWISHPLTLLGDWDGGTSDPPTRIVGRPGDTVIIGQNVRTGISISGAGTVTIRDLWIYGCTPGIASMDTDLVLESVIVSNCFVDEAESGLGGQGGGIAIFRGSLVVAQGSEFRDSRAHDGGAIFAYDVASLTVEDSSFYGNYATVHGGAILLLGRGRDAIPLTVRRSEFSANSAGLGAAIEAEDAVTGVFESSFTFNQASLSGIIFPYGDTFRPETWLERNFVAYNQANSYILRIEGTATLRNNMIVENTRTALWIDSAASAVLESNTIVGSDKNTDYGVCLSSNASATLKNNAFCRLRVGVEHEADSSLTLGRSFWGAGSWANGDNYYEFLPSLNLLDPGVSGDPAFGFDFRIGASSAARNQAKAGVAGDWEGDSRGTRPDLGADEYSAVVRVLWPNGGESLASGEEADLIRWSAPDRAATFTVWYSLDDGARWNLIRSGVTSRSLLWAAPRGAANMKRCRIKVAGYTAAGRLVGSDISNKPFAIDTVRLIGPNGGERLESRENRMIRWRSGQTVRPVARVLLQLSIDGGATWKSIAPAPAPGDPGTHWWAAPALATTSRNCKLRVVLMDAAGRILGRDTSDAPFTILDP